MTAAPAMAPTDRDATRPMAGPGAPPQQAAPSWAMDRAAQQQARLRFLAQSLAPEQKLDFGALATRQPAPAARTEPGPTDLAAAPDRSVGPLPAHEIRPALEAALRSGRSAAESGMVGHAEARLAVREPAATRSKLPSRLALASLGLLVTVGAVGYPTFSDLVQDRRPSSPKIAENRVPAVAPPPAAPAPVHAVMTAPAVAPEIVPDVPVTAAVAAMPAPDGRDAAVEVALDPPELPLPIEIAAIPPAPVPTISPAVPPADVVTEPRVAIVPEPVPPVADIVVAVEDIPSLVMVADVSALLPPQDAAPTPRAVAVEIAPEPARLAAPAPAPEPAPTIVEPRSAASFTEPSTVAMVARAQAILAHGDIFGARLLLKRAADLGSAEAEAVLARLPANARAIGATPARSRP